MAHAITFDTFQHAKKLKQAGFTEVQVEAQIEIVKEQTSAINEFIDDSIATKQDIKELDLKIEANKNELKRDIKEIELKLKELELRMTVKLGSLMIGGIGILVFLMKLFKL